MIIEAIKATGKPVRGASRVSIAKYLEAKYGKVLGSHFKVILRLALRRLVASKKVIKTKGSFRVAKSEKKPKKAKKAKKAKKPKVKKAKKSKAKKVKKTKKPKSKKAKQSKKAKAAKPASA